MNSRPVVGIIMGSDSDYKVMKDHIYWNDNINYDCNIVSNRTPDRMYEYAKSAKIKGIKVMNRQVQGVQHIFLEWWHH